MRLEERGAIYKGKYEGWYCVSDEEFLTDAQVCDSEDLTDADGNAAKVSIANNNEVVWMKEENYMFRLSDYAGPLLQWLDENPNTIIPRHRSNEVRAMIESGLPDLSVSRGVAKLDWGIRVPGDPNHTIYVWLDALANYLTVAGFPSSDALPVDFHVIGKDIVKFHAIYWPAFLMAADLPLPRKIVAHAHWTLNNQKMAKSRGNVVDPVEKLDLYGVDQLRFFLLRDGRLQHDADYNEARVVGVIDELANKLGNLLSRSTGKKINKARAVPRRASIAATEGAEELQAAMAAAVEQTVRHFDAVEFGEGIEVIILLLKATNAYFDAAKPWILAREADDVDTQAQLDTVLYVTFESLRLSSILLQPVIPELAAGVLDRLGLQHSERSTAHLEFGLLDGQALSGDTKPLIQKPPQAA